MSRITDPARLLPPFIPAIEVCTACYLVGCYQPAIVSRLHKRFGRVATCHTHDPERFAYTRPFGRQVPALTPRTQDEHSPTDSGHRVKVTRPTPNKPSPAMVINPF